MSEHEQGNTINIHELLGILLKNYLFLIILTVVITTIVGFYTKFAIAPKYESKTLVIVNKIVDKDSNSYSSDIFRYGSELAKRYSIIANSNTVVDNVQKHLIENYNLELGNTEIKNSFEVVSVNETEILQLTVTYPDSEIAMRLANVISSESMKVYEEKYIDATVAFIDVAEENTIPVSPNIKLNIVIGFVLGLMISVGAVLINEFLNRKIRSERDVEYYLSIPYLGSVPDFKKLK